VLRLHLFRPEPTIVNCEVLVLDRRGHPILVPPVFFGPNESLILDPSAGIQAWFIRMQAKHDARIEWRLLPGEGLSAAQLRNTGGFGQPTCRAVSPDQLPR
jgi:hypothetical protein